MLRPAVIAAAMLLVGVVPSLSIAAAGCAASARPIASRAGASGNADFPAHIVYRGMMFVPHFAHPLSIELFNRKGVLTGTMRATLAGKVQASSLTGTVAGGRCAFMIGTERYEGPCDRRQFKGALLDAPEEVEVTFDLEVASAAE